MFKKSGASSITRRQPSGSSRLAGRPCSLSGELTVRPPQTKGARAHSLAESTSSASFFFGDRHSSTASELERTGGLHGLGTLLAHAVHGLRIRARLCHGPRVSRLSTLACDCVPPQSECFITAMTLCTMPGRRAVCRTVSQGCARAADYVLIAGCFAAQGSDPTSGCVAKVTPSRL